MTTALALDPRGSRVRNNLAVNPRFTTNVSAWTAAPDSSMTRVSEAAAWAAEWKATSAGAKTQLVTLVAPGSGKKGRYYGARFKIRRGTSFPSEATLSPRIYDGSQFITSGFSVTPTEVLTEYLLLSSLPAAATVLDALSFRLYASPTPWAIGDSVIITDLIFGEVEGFDMAPEKFFDGSTLAAGGKVYGWTAAANASSSIETTTPDPDTATTAIFALGYEVTRAVRTIVHEVPNALSAPVTFKPAGSRSGRIQYLFETREECRRAEIIHSRVGYVTLSDPDWPGSPMRYVPQDEVTTTLDPETRKHWLLTTGFVEVPA